MLDQIQAWESRLAPIFGGLSGTLLGAIVGSIIRYESPLEPTLTFAVDGEPDSFRGAAAKLRPFAVFPGRVPWVVSEFVDANQLSGP